MSIADTLAAVAGSLPGPLLERLAKHLAAVPTPNSLSLAQAKDLAPVPVFREACNEIWQQWSATPDLRGQALSLALRAACTAAAAQRAVVTIEPVVTGPSSWLIPVRQTTDVVTDIVRNARESLMLISFAAYKVPDLVSELRAAAISGVLVRMLLETAGDSHGALSHDAAKPFSELGGRVRFLIWPADRRPVPPGGRASMHVKALLADRDVAFVTSANLTGNALDHNMELGVLVRGGQLPAKLTDHYDELLATGVLRDAAGAGDQQLPARSADSR